MNSQQERLQVLLAHPGLISVWDFQEEAGQPRVAKGPYPYALQEQSGPVSRAAEGVLGPYAADIAFGQWFNLPRAAAPALNIGGANAQLTVAAWVKREQRDTPECQAVAGMWDETRKKRQYCLFLDLKIWDSQDQVCGHVSGEGGPTPGYKYCMSSAIGNSPVVKGEWHAIAFTYDGQTARCYLDGKLDEREQWNPFAYEGGLFDGGTDGADFTVAAVNRSGVPGNFYSGLLGGLAVFNRALTEEDIEGIVR
ncbi:LamG domain-containing protein [Paenibacillus daejeonensis]|uniref:LamG domain-containing protein n=1 Tax=Paenibacillus daejeonensis TaxID=135193 RepID=UPI0003782476|nr:LamG domain-containing protein [Paenibacillus daejeonensis]